MIAISMKGKWGTGKTLFVDDDNYDLVTKWKWHVDWRGYAVRNVWIDGKSVTIQLHSIINKTPKGMQTDHINGNRLDNRKENLRTVTPTENARNTFKKTDTKKYKGIHKNPVGRWVVQTHIGYEQQYFGTYDSEEVAARVYDYVMYNFVGEFAKLNFPGEIQSEEYNPAIIQEHRYSK